MELTNEFEVGVPVEQAWAVLTDVERIAPCLPGAQLQEVEGDEYRGLVTVKVGPITAQYKGTASFVEKDDAAHVATLKAVGRDARGNGNANALITASLEPVGAGTRVTVETDLQITGKVAQFGRGVLADVSARLLGQFVENLEATVLGEQSPPGAAGDGPASTSTGPRRVDAPVAEPVDLLDTAGAPVAKRLVPAIAAVVLLALIVRWRRDRRG